MRLSLFYLIIGYILKNFHVEGTVDFKSDEEAYEQVMNWINQNRTISKSFLKHTIYKNWNKTSTELIINYFNKNIIDIYDSFIESRQQIQPNQLAFFNSLTKLLPENSSFLNTIEPCYIWAQNMTHLFIKIKFSNRLDVPGALEINRLDYNITMPEFQVSAYTFRNSPATRYLLRIKTYKFMNPNFYRVQEVELGQVVFEILKSPSPYFWKNIHSELFYNPPNQYVWWDMYYQYREQLNVAFGLLEDAENSREEAEDKKLYRDDLIIKQKREYEKRLMEEIDIVKEENNYQLYCRQSIFNQNKCYKFNPSQWSSWVM